MVQVKSPGKLTFEGRWLFDKGHFTVNTNIWDRKILTLKCRCPLNGGDNKHMCACTRFSRENKPQFYRVYTRISRFADRFQINLVLKG